MFPPPCIRVSLLLACAVIHAHAAVIDLNSGSDDGLWVPLGANYDFKSDQQTGQGADDIVGDGSSYGFLTQFNDNNTVGVTTDDHIAFRVRMNEQDKATFTGYVWVGIDIDQRDVDGDPLTNDRDIDVYIRHSNSPSTSSVSLHAPGTGLNVSPSTTSIVATPTTEWDLAANPNYVGYREVNPTIDGGVLNADTVSGDTNNDWYVSFQLPFQGLVDYANANLGWFTLTDDFEMSYIVATSTNQNTLNQDLGGVDGGTTSIVTWGDLGALVGPVTSTGLVPEPSSSLLLLLGGIGLLLRRRR